PDVDAGDVRGLYEAVQTLLDQDLCSRTTIAPTAAFSLRWPRWRLLVAAVWSWKLACWAATRLPRFFARKWAL
ncbi:MAG: hypothetical protein OXI35_02935, partial [Gemmatimonadota bacterium]|nr:hypothetical protein [Gemmatimonadota bacterium]